MGIKGLTQLLAARAPKAMKHQKLESYFGREIAIDANMSINQFLIFIEKCGAQTLTNEAGVVTSHLQVMLARTIRLLQAGIKPVYVFDGTPPDLKKQGLATRFLKRAVSTKDLDDALKATDQHYEDCKKLFRLMDVPVIEAPSEAESQCSSLCKAGKVSSNLNDALKRGNEEDIEKFSKRTVNATTGQHYEDCKKLLRLMGVPVVEAPSEAESQCSALCKAGKVYAVASEDMDSLTFGAPRFLRHLMEHTSKKIPVVEFEVSKVLEELNLTMDQFIDLCILSGCDYCETIRGIGGLTALKLIRQHGSIEHILDNINKERYHVPFDWPYQETRELFRKPPVLSDVDQLELKWTYPDEEGLVRFLVDENSFNIGRVTEAIKKTKTAINNLG